MAKAANIPSGNSRQPDEDGHDSDRASNGKLERKKNPRVTAVDA